MTRLILSRITLFAVCMLSTQTQATNLSLADEPLYTGQNVAPMMMLVMGRDHTLYYEAYNDASDLDGDGVLDIKFKPSISYEGYFDSSKCYSYSSSLFTPQRVAATCTVNGEWSGNFLNYLTMTRMDLLRKVLYGGYRSTDSSNGTVLERSFIPQDAHSWAKAYTSFAVDGYKIADYTPYSEPNSSKQHFFGSVTYTSDSSAPILRVRENVSYTSSDWGVWSWASTERPVLNASGTDYTVRVSVCNSELYETNCKKYTDESDNNYYKPTGLLHDYGEDDSMLFGLLTGSFNANLSGGVLRKAMSKFSEEVDPNNGQFISDSGIVATINKLKVHGFGYSDKSYQTNCGWITTRAITEGQCASWGNPVGEMLYESLRYFAGTKAQSGSYNNTSRGYDSSLGLTTATWDDPYDFSKYCAKASNLLISDINPSYDSDQLPGAYSGFSATYSGSTLADFSLTGLLATISAGEKIGTSNGDSNYYFIGQSGSNDDGAPTAKQIAGLGSARGLAPAEPTKKGSYSSSGVAFYGMKTDLRSDLKGTQNVTTSVVSLASSLPEVEVNIDGQIIKIIPFAKSIGGSSINSSASSFQPTNTIVDWYVESKSDTSGVFRINFEDVEQGADHDMDMIVKYSYEVQTVSGTKRLAITLDSTYAAGGIDQHAGYVISGTSNDGLYLEVKDQGGADVKYYLDTPDSNVYAPRSTSNNGNLPLTATRYFYPSTKNAAEFLESPLYYAAKWGNFTDSNKDDEPLVKKEWDSNDDGLPDAYFPVTNASELSTKLGEAFESIFTDGASATSPVFSSTFLQAGAYFFNSSFASEFWSGDVKAYPITKTGSFSSTASWSAADLLDARTVDSRTIYTRNGENVFEFTTSANLSDKLSSVQLNSLLGSFTASTTITITADTTLTTAAANATALATALREAANTAAATAAETDATVLRDEATTAATIADATDATALREAANTAATLAAATDATVLRATATELRAVANTATTTAAAATEAATKANEAYEAAQLAEAAVNTASSSNNNTQKDAAAVAAVADAATAAKAALAVATDATKEKAQAAVDAATISTDKMGDASGNNGWKKDDAADAAAAAATAAALTAKNAADDAVTTAPSAEATAAAEDAATAAENAAAAAEKADKDATDAASAAAAAEQADKDALNAEVAAAAAEKADNAATAAENAATAAENADNAATAAEKAAVDAATAATDAVAAATAATADTTTTTDTDYLNALIEYLRGDRSYESEDASYQMRTRASRLGDVINSTPYYVAESNGHNVKQDLLAFGANDGMVHLLNADTGDELMAYIPSGVYGQLNALTKTTYSHQFSVDGGIAAYSTDDTVPKTTLVGSLGSGGSGIYAIDVSDISTPQTSMMKWEITPDSIGYEGLGNTSGAPTIAKLHSLEGGKNRVGVVFANGYNSSNSEGVIYIADLEDGSLIKKLGVGTLVDPSGNNWPNAMASPTVIDLNGDGVADRIYAGDLYGNMWAFDISNTDEDYWGNAIGAKPLFTATSPTTVNSKPRSQSITSHASVAAHPKGVSKGVLVAFGTGKYIESGDDSAVDQATQSFYVIWDKLDGKQVMGTNSPTSAATRDVTKNNQYDGLLMQEIELESNGYRYLSENKVNWNTDSGFYIDLINTADDSAGNLGERQITSSLLSVNKVTFTTLIPDGDPCVSGGTSWYMVMDIYTGLSWNNGSYIADNVDSVIIVEESTNQLLDGIATGAVTAISVTSDDTETTNDDSTASTVESQTPEVTETTCVTLSGGDTQCFTGESATVGRMTWQQLY